MSAQAFTFTVELAHFMDVIKSRSGTTRPVATEVTLTVALPVLTSDEAPVAAVVRQPWELRDREVRHYGGHFYVPLHSNAKREAVLASAGSPTRVVLVVEHHPQNEDEAKQAAASTLSETVIIDGQVWRRGGEPIYVVRTLGSGAAFLSTSDATFEKTENTAPEMIFSVFEDPAVIEKALQDADTSPEPERVRRPMIVVMDPRAPWTVLPRKR